MLDLILGGGWQWIAGAVGAVALVVGGLWQRRAGARQERNRQAAQHAREYRDERKRIDESDLGLGATDSERQRMLRDIADRRGSGDR